jgi:8-oxo-dGTP diphosphatase
LIRRGKEPFANHWALPGGFLEATEATEEAAARELLEETGFRTNDRPTLLGIWDQPNRDPRGRVISVAYSMVIPHTTVVRGMDDAVEAAWVQCEKVGLLAFDHNEILKVALGKHGFS